MINMRGMSVSKKAPAGRFEKEKPENITDPLLKITTG